MLAAWHHVTIWWLLLVLKHSSTAAYSFLCSLIQDWLQLESSAVTNAVSLVCYLGNRRVVMAWGLWTCPTWERMRLFPDAEGWLCMLASACLPACNTARHPFTHSFMLAAYTYVHSPGGGWLWQMQRGGKRLRTRGTLTTFSKAFYSIPSCWKAQSGVLRLKSATWEHLKRGSSLNLDPVFSSYRPTHSLSYPACIYS